MKLTSVIERFKKNYELAVLSDYVRKPISHALYKTWKYVDAHEKAREIKKENEDG